MSNIGTIVQVVGPVLDIRFADGQLPNLLNAIEIQHRGAKLTVEVAQHIGDNVESDVETEALLKETLEKFDVYHLAINDRDSSYSWHAKGIKATWGKYFDEEHFKVVTLDNLASVVNNIIKNHCSNNISSEGISW